MINKTLGAALLAVTLTFSGAASAAGMGFYYMSELTQGQGATMKMFATKKAAKAAQDQINHSPELRAAIRAHGIQIKNVVLSKTAGDGSLVFYIK